MLLRKSQAVSGEKGLEMATGFNMMLLHVNLSKFGLLPALGWPRQGALRCRRQSLLLHFLLAVLTFFARVRFSLL